MNSTSAKEGNFVFPLYLYPNGKMPEEDLFAHDNGRRPNLSAEFIKDFCEKLKVKFVPEGLGRPGKREVGPEIDFPLRLRRVPQSRLSRALRGVPARGFSRVCPSRATMNCSATLAGFGGELVDLHARGKGEPRDISFPIKGGNIIEEVRYQPPQGKEPGRVWINDRQYFEGVPEKAWAFPIGGYLPAQRWLKDRIGRTLGYEEQAEYQRIIWALIETRRLMAEIDASIRHTAAGR